MALQGLLLALLISISAVQSKLKLESSCEKLPTRIHITKEEFSKAKELMRTCEEDVELAKCEGSCVSSTMPSAMERSSSEDILIVLRSVSVSRSGFMKDCKCCREVGYNERVVTLHSCYDQDGVRLTGSLAQMQVTIKEPSSCACHKCGSSPPLL